MSLNLNSSENTGKYISGDKPKYTSLNTIAEALKTSSTTITSGNIQQHSSSSGNSYQVNERLLRPPIWAMITNVSLVALPPDYFEIPSGWANNSLCYGFFLGGSFRKKAFYYWVYSWVEVNDDFYISRITDPKTIRGNCVFPVKDSYVPAKGVDISFDTCLRYPPVQNKDFNHGTLRNNPLYNVNPHDPAYVSPGAVFKIYYGAGDYMLFNPKSWRSRYGETRNHDFEQAWLPDRDHP